MSDRRASLYSTVYLVKSCWMQRERAAAI